MNGYQKKIKMWDPRPAGGKRDGLILEQVELAGKRPRQQVGHLPH